MANEYEARSEHPGQTAQASPLKSAQDECNILFSMLMQGTLKIFVPSLPQASLCCQSGAPFLPRVLRGSAARQERRRTMQLGGRVANPGPVLPLPPRRYMPVDIMPNLDDERIDIHLNDGVRIVLLGSIPVVQPEVMILAFKELFYRAYHYEAPAIPDILAEENWEDDHRVEIPADYSTWPYQMTRYTVNVTIVGEDGSQAKLTRAINMPEDEYYHSLLDFLPPYGVEYLTFPLPYVTNSVTGTVIRRTLNASAWRAELRRRRQLAGECAGPGPIVYGSLDEAWEEPRRPDPRPRRIPRSPSTQGVPRDPRLRAALECGEPIIVEEQAYVPSGPWLRWLRYKALRTVAKTGNRRPIPALGVDDEVLRHAEIACPEASRIQMRRALARAGAPRTLADLAHWDATVALQESPHYRKYYWKSKELLVAEGIEPNPGPPKKSKTRHSPYDAIKAASTELVDSITFALYQRFHDDNFSATLRTVFMEVRQSRLVCMTTLSGAIESYLSFLRCVPVFPEAARSDLDAESFKLTSQNVNYPSKEVSDQDAILLWILSNELTLDFINPTGFFRRYLGYKPIILTIGNTGYGQLFNPVEQKKADNSRAAVSAQFVKAQQDKEAEALARKKEREDKAARLAEQREADKRKRYEDSIPERVTMEPSAPSASSSSSDADSASQAQEAAAALGLQDAANVSQQTLASEVKAAASADDDEDDGKDEADNTPRQADQNFLDQISSGQDKPVSEFTAVKKHPLDPDYISTPPSDPYSGQDGDQQYVVIPDPRDLRKKTLRELQQKRERPVPLAVFDRARLVFIPEEEEDFSGFLLYGLYRGILDSYDYHGGVWILDDDLIDAQLDAQEKRATDLKDQGLALKLLLDGRIGPAYFTAHSDMSIRRLKKQGLPTENTVAFDATHLIAYDTDVYIVHADALDSHLRLAVRRLTSRQVVEFPVPARWCQVAVRRHYGCSMSYEGTLIQVRTLAQFSDNTFVDPKFMGYQDLKLRAFAAFLFAHAQAKPSPLLSRGEVLKNIKMVRPLAEGVYVKPYLTSEKVLEDKYFFNGSGDFAIATHSVDHSGIVIHDPANLKRTAAYKDWSRLYPVALVPAISRPDPGSLSEQVKGIIKRLAAGSIAITDEAKLKLQNVVWPKIATAISQCIYQVYSVAEIREACEKVCTMKNFSQQDHDSYMRGADLFLQGARGLDNLLPRGWRTQFGAFTKVENYNPLAEKAVRTIQCPDLFVRGYQHAMLYTAQHNMFEVAFKAFTVKGLDEGEKLKKVRDLYLATDCFASTDITSMEKNVTGYFMNFEEEIFVGLSPLWMRPAIRDCWKELETTQRAFHHQFFTLFTDPMRASGEDHTSAGNFICNFLWICFLTDATDEFLSGKRKLLIEGDDAVFDARGLKLNMDLARELGIRLKIERSEEELSFVKKRFVQGHHVCDVREIALNFSVEKDPDFDTIRNSLPRQYAMALSYYTLYRDQPVVGPFFLDYLVKYHAQAMGSQRGFKAVRRAFASKYVGWVDEDTIERMWAEVINNLDEVPQLTEEEAFLAEANAMSVRELHLWFTPCDPHAKLDTIKHGGFEVIEPVIPQVTALKNTTLMERSVVNLRGRPIPFIHHSDRDSYDEQINAPDLRKRGTLVPDENRRPCRVAAAVIGCGLAASIWTALCEWYPAVTIAAAYSTGLTILTTSILALIYFYHRAHKQIDLHKKDDDLHVAPSQTAGPPPLLRVGKEISLPSISPNALSTRHPKLQPVSFRTRADRTDAEMWVDAFFEAHPAPEPSAPPPPPAGADAPREVELVQLSPAASSSSSSGSFDEV